MGGRVPGVLYSLGECRAQRCEWGGTVCPDEQTSRYHRSTHTHTHTHLFIIPSWLAGYWPQVPAPSGVWNDVNCGRTAGYVCKELPGTTTPTLHPHSPGRGTVPKVCFPISLGYRKCAAISSSHVKKITTSLPCRLDAFQEQVLPIQRQERWYQSQLVLCKELVQGGDLAVIDDH